MLEISRRSDADGDSLPDFSDPRYQLQAGGRICLTTGLDKLLKAEVKCVKVEDCKRDDGRWHCPLCPNRHFRRQAELETHHVYHQSEPIPDGLNTCQGVVVQHLARKDAINRNMLETSGSDPFPVGGLLSRSSELIRRHLGTCQMKNKNKVRAHVLLDEPGPRLSNDVSHGFRLTRSYYATTKFLLLVVSFCDFRTQSKYQRVRDRIIDHYVSRGSELCFLVPQLNLVWEAIYRAALDVSAGYKQHCVNKLSFRVVSLDSSYKCPAVVNTCAHFVDAAHTHTLVSVL